MNTDSIATKAPKECKDFSGVVAAAVSRRKLDFKGRELTSPAPPPAACAADGARPFGSGEHPIVRSQRPPDSSHMSTETLLIIVVLVLLFGGGFFYSRRGR